MSGESDAESCVSDASDIREMRKEVEQSQRQSLLARLRRLSERTGIQSRHANLNWTSESLQEEIDRVEHEMSLRKSIKFQRRVLLTFASGVEYAHNKTPLQGNLDGWGETLMDSIDDFDEVFARLHEKHGSKFRGKAGKPMEPEAQLLYLLAYNAVTFAITQKITKMALQPTLQPPQDISPDKIHEISEMIKQAQERLKDSKEENQVFADEPSIDDIAEEVEIESENEVENEDDGEDEGKEENTPRSISGDITTNKSGDRILNFA